MASAAVVIAAPAIPLSKVVDGVNVSIGEEGANVPELKKICNTSGIYFKGYTVLPKLTL